MVDLKHTVDGLEKERDFYFAKLRDIELICQENENHPVLGKIIDILYATEVNKVKLQKSTRRHCYRVVVLIYLDGITEAWIAHVYDCVHKLWDT